MTSKHLKTLLVIFIVLAVGIGFLLYPKSATPPSITQAQKTLMLISDRCAGISENSVADKKAIVAFQELEIQGNKANVVVSCMRDNGYVQNPAWLQYAQPIAKKDAEKNHVSVDEALTALARHDMLILNEEKDRPIYWVKIK